MFLKGNGVIKIVSGRKDMNKYPLIGGSICAVVLLVLASLTNVVGFQTVQSSNQKIITDEVNEKDLLFQTIVNMANNKEIQRVILGSELIGKRFYDPGMRFSTFTPPIVTKRFLNFAYQMGLILSKTFSKIMIHPLRERYRMDNVEMQREISSVIEKDSTLKREMKQLSDIKCDCGNDGTTWGYTIICTLLYPLYLFLDWVIIGYYGIYFLRALFEIILTFGQNAQCWWYIWP